MKAWNLYTSKEIKPLGWIKRQLEIQAEGLSGNLDKIWKDVRDSSWIGGDADGWERVPYWLDGFIPLAYLLDNADMKARAKKYIDSIISSQCPDGWICPCSEEERPKYDTWAAILLTKVLTVYYECTSDERIPGVIYSTLKNYYELLKSKSISLFWWGKFRWYEAFIAINFLYERYGEPWIKELALILKEQGADYASFTELWKRPINRWRIDTHIVNLGMMLKYEAVSCGILGDEYKNIAEELYQFLYKYNGTPLGMFTGDECLSGLSPIQGTELCAVAEQMYSYELLFAYTGDKKWLERLELLAFNAFPATVSDDMWTHQYDQMSNQISCERFPGKSLFRTNGSEAHLFGLEPNYGCCTANFNQAWPKFALSLFMHKDDTVINTVPVPAELDCNKAYIKLETKYPFENCFKYTVKAKEDFCFEIRVPSFAKELTADGVPVNELKFSLNAGEEREINVSFRTEPYMEARPYGLKTVKCGSLVFSVPIKYEKKMYEYERDGVERKFPYCDYEYIPLSDWNYAYSSDELSLIPGELGEVPFSSDSPAVKIKAKVKKIFAIDKL